MTESLGKGAPHEPEWGGRVNDERGIPLEFYEGDDSEFPKRLLNWRGGKTVLILGKRTYSERQIRRVLEAARSCGDVIADYRPDWEQYEPVYPDIPLSAESIRDRIDNWAECGWTDDDSEAGQLWFVRHRLGTVESIWRDMDSLRRSVTDGLDVPDCPIGRGDAETATENDYLNALRLARRWCNEWLQTAKRDKGTGEPPQADVDDNEPNEMTAAVRLAWLSFEAAELQADKRLTDREAYDILMTDGLATDKGDLGELADYDPPAFDSWSRYLRDARKVMGESKYNKRVNRSHGKSIAKRDQL